MLEKYGVYRTYYDYGYYRSKGLEANVIITSEEINEIYPLKYSKSKLKILYLLRRINSGIKTIFAR